jgi:hypothetical protein
VDLVGHTSRSRGTLFGVDIHLESFRQTKNNGRSTVSDGFIGGNDGK